MLAGVPLFDGVAGFEQTQLLAFTEQNTRAEIDDLVAALGRRDAVTTTPDELVAGAAPEPLLSELSRPGAPGHQLPHLDVPDVDDLGGQLLRADAAACQSLASSTSSATSPTSPSATSRSTRSSIRSARAR